ncbi:MAG: hypothetical protein RBT49_04505 [Bacteroidales bacterium]|jgi:hypothetical protein|nr:hypothetical protein [Bacteroidales bacterium]
MDIFNKILDAQMRHERVNKNSPLKVYLGEKETNEIKEYLKISGHTFDRKINERFETIFGMKIYYVDAEEHLEVY